MEHPREHEDEDRRVQQIADDTDAHVHQAE